MVCMNVSLFTRTPLHIGSGHSVGIVDLPILRERATDFPIIPGSALKGVLVDLYVSRGDGQAPELSDEGKRLFGEQNRRGAVLIGESRLLAFPVRSAKQAFAWLTSPLTLARHEIPFKGAMGENEVLAADTLCVEKTAIFEEYRLNRKDPVPGETVEVLRGRCEVPLWKDSLASRLAVVSDTLFQYFAKNACEIAQHNQIDDVSGIVKQGHLFAQENVPSETLFVGQWMADSEEPLRQLRDRVEQEDNLLQVGADATTGLGWCAFSFGDIHGRRLA